MMKRSLLVVLAGLLMCLTAGPVAAQVTWEAGFKVGLGLGKLRGDTGFSETLIDGGSTIVLSGDIGDFRTAFTGGAFANAMFTDAFGVRLEVLYAQRGGKGPVSLTIDGNPAGTVDVTFKHDYIEIPIMAVGSFPAGSKARLNVFGGPAVAFNTGAKVRVEAQGVSDETDNSDTVESTDFGIAAGAGISIAASASANIVIDGRYTLGLSKVPTTGEDLKNSSLAFMAGVSFPLGGARSNP